MPHVPLPDGAYGIVSLMLRFPDTGQLLGALSEQLLRGPSSLTPAEREVIAMRVSDRNECGYCAGTHHSTARALLAAGDPAAGSLSVGPVPAAEMAVDAKLAALLTIAVKVAEDGRRVAAADVTAAKAAGADDRAVHDTVLIAAALSMFNRYVDGLATTAPPDQDTYDAIGASLAENGYLAIAPAAG